LPVHLPQIVGKLCEASPTTWPSYISVLIILLKGQYMNLILYSYALPGYVERVPVPEFDGLDS